MDKTAITENELLEDLAKQYENVSIRDDEVTAKMLADRTGVSSRTALNRLDGLVRSGKLVSREVLIDGHWANAYSKKNDSEGQ
jgi:predicted HTH transcriptional regulator